MRSLRTVTLWSSLAACTHAKYVWPDKSDFLEDLYAIQDGIIRFGFTDLVVPCGFNSGTVGRQLSAEWIRTVFHDTVTHDHAKGTGGLDASIMFETERDENKGAAFNNTLSDIYEFISPRSSGADMLALSLVASVASCGGQKVPLRMGRVDAVEAGPSGVPKPEHDLQSATDAFTKAGFTQEEMIALVACGHTLGGVHSTENPAIVEGEPSPSNKPTFDRTNNEFDNEVVNEYFANDGVNPLVFGHNETTNSDKRIFGSDKNVTMTKMKDPNTFQSTCAIVFERLIDTVPSSVELSEPIELVDVKPYIDKLEPAENPSQIAFEGKIRVRTSESTGRDADTLEVSINVLSSNGTRTKVPATRLLGGGGKSYGFFNEVFTWFQFATEFDASAGLRAFDIHLKSGEADEIVLDNQGTGGFPVQDGLLFVHSKSCRNTTAENGNFTITVEAAVRNDLVDEANGPVVQMAHRIPQQGAVLPRVSVQPSKMAMIKQEGVPSYTHYKAEIPVLAEESTTTFDIELETKSGKISSDFHWTNRLSC